MNAPVPPAPAATARHAAFVPPVRPPADTAPQTVPAPPPATNPLPHWDALAPAAPKGPWAALVGMLTDRPHPWQVAGTAGVVLLLLVALTLSA